MVSDVLLLPYFLGVAIAIHDIVLDLHQRCELFTALLLQDKLGSELQPAAGGAELRVVVLGGGGWR